MVNPLVLSMAAPPPRQLLVRTGRMLREACCITSGRCALDHVREPAGLQFVPTPRTRRLMRNARVSAW
jgi:hypothetical protein